MYTYGHTLSLRYALPISEAESEWASGFHTEYSGMKFGMFFVCEYVGIVLVSAITVVLFFGGWSGPFLDKWPWLSIVWFSLKCLVFMSGFILLRASLPRPRRSEEHTSELQSLMRNSYAVFCLKNNRTIYHNLPSPNMFTAHATTCPG